MIQTRGKDAMRIVAWAMSRMLRSRGVDLFLLALLLVEDEDRGGMEVVNLPVLTSFALGLVQRRAVLDKHGKRERVVVLRRRTRIARLPGGGFRPEPWPLACGLVPFRYTALFTTFFLLSGSWI